MGNNTLRGGFYTLLAFVCVWSSTVQIFKLTFGLPISTLPPPHHSESLAADYSGADGRGGVILDILNKDGLTDGAVTLELSSTSFSCGEGPGCNGSVAPVSADQILHHRGVNSDIRINGGFSLTPGDRATFDTRLEMVPVPVPAAAWLFGFCLIGLAGVARRLKTVR